MEDGELLVRQAQGLSSSYSEKKYVGDSIDFFDRKKHENFIVTEVEPDAPSSGGIRTAMQ